MCLCEYVSVFQSLYMQVCISTFDFLISDIQNVCVDNYDMHIPLCKNRWLSRFSPIPLPSSSCFYQCAWLSWRLSWLLPSFLRPTILTLLLLTSVFFCITAVQQTFWGHSSVSASVLRSNLCLGALTMMFSNIFTFGVDLSLHLLADSFLCYKSWLPIAYIRLGLLTRRIPINCLFSHFPDIKEAR